MTSITNKNVNYVNTNDFPLIIHNPGIYKLTEDIKLDKLFKKKTFSAGHFAAITVKSNRVVIDLNGYSIYQSDWHASFFRFFSIIELMDWPFSKKNGGQFAPNFPTTSANYCIIKNGIIGRSSHFGIHGNNNSFIWLKNLTIKNFEVAGISLNFINGLICENLNIGPSSTNVLINQHFTQLCAAFYLSNSNEIKKEVKKIINEIKKNGNTEDSKYNNINRLPQANLTGIQITPFGTSVGPFQTKYQKKNSQHIFMQNITIDNLKTNIIEIIRESKNGKVLTGLINESLCPACFTKDNIYLKIINYQSIGKETEKKYGLDIANHINKGIYAIRLDGVEHFNLDKIIIKNIINISKNSINQNEVITANLAYNKNYIGTDSYGIIISNCKTGNLDIEFKNIVSKKGKSSALIIQHKSKNITGFIKSKFINGKKGNAQSIISKNSEAILKIE